MIHLKHLIASTLVACTATLGLACSSSSSTATDNDAGGSTLPNCPSSGKNAFDTYQAAGFVAVNNAIFTNVTNELTKNGTKNLGTSFNGIGMNGADDLATFEGKLAAFLVYAYGGPSSITYTDGKTYSGVQSMTAAHKGFDITTDQYDYFVTNIIVPALTTSKVSSDDISTCFAPVITSSAFEASIIGQ